ncbi:MAG: hypothetical protein OXI03_02720, partial [Chloroflexota bacterium]|nr:hypothetical protein [Chloroflexota bacterium]
GARGGCPAGWLHRRASNTSPYLSLRIEAETRRAFDEIRAAVWDALAPHAEVTLAGVAAEPLPPEGFFEAAP